MFLGSWSGSISQSYGSGSFPFLVKVLSGYNDFDFIDKMDPPRPLIVAKLNSKKQLKCTFLVFEPFRPR
jgi:hypothetical protein